MTDIVGIELGTRPCVHPSLHRHPAIRPVTALGNGILHRAIVALPSCMVGADRPLQERVVFFEAPSEFAAAAHLERLLASAWCTDTTQWAERGHIYNVEAVRERLHDERSSSFAEPAAGELRLLDTGCGGDGPGAVGPDRIHFARAADVDLFVTPRVAERLRALLAQIEAMYAAEPARRTKGAVVQREARHG